MSQSPMPLPRLSAIDQMATSNQSVDGSVVAAADGCSELAMPFRPDEKGQYAGFLRSAR